MIVLSVVVWPVCAQTSVAAQSKNLREGDGMEFVRELIQKSQIKGTLYDSTRIILNLTGEHGSDEFLIDSIFELQKFNDDKIGFFCAFSEAASDIRFGYVEISFHPYQTKFELLNDRIEKMKISYNGARYKMLVHTSSNVRYVEKTRIVYLISSNEKDQFSIQVYDKKNIQVGDGDHSF